MFFLASLSGKNIIFSLDSGKILPILRCCLEICLSKVCTNPVISLSNILSEDAGESNVYSYCFQDIAVFCSIRKLIVKTESHFLRSVRHSFS